MVKALTIFLAVLAVLLQYPLWLGKRSWLGVWELDQQITAQRENNRKMAIRNSTLDAEVRDLKQGYDAIEERARNELGLIRQDETFFHIVEGNKREAFRSSGPEDGLRK